MLRSTRASGASAAILSQTHAHRPDHLFSVRHPAVVAAGFSLGFWLLAGGTIMQGIRGCGGVCSFGRDFRLCWAEAHRYEGEAKTSLLDSCRFEWIQYQRARDCVFVCGAGAGLGAFYR